MKNSTLFLSKVAILLTLATFFMACPQKSPCEKNPDSPECTEGTELITTVILDFGSASVGKPKWKDTDGAAGNAPTIDTIFLAANQVYQPVKITLLDESKTPADSISNEVKNEQNDHQFFFNPQTTNLTVSYLDKDANNLPVGLETKWISTNAGVGNIQIVLKHQPGTKNNTISTGDTDIDVVFPVRIK